MGGDCFIDKNLFSSKNIEIMKKQIYLLFFCSGDVPEFIDKSPDSSNSISWF